jgi:hypothetical protein
MGFSVWFDIIICLNLLLPNLVLLYDQGNLGCLTMLHGFWQFSVSGVGR